MTNDEILTMEAGREIDALVAEQVMGWIKRTIGNSTIEAWYSEDKEGYMQNPVSERYYYSGSIDYPFSPSTDISHAWEVMEKFKERSWSLYWERGHWVVEEMHVTAETAPLAICRAALLTTEE